MFLRTAAAGVAVAGAVELVPVLVGSDWQATKASSPNKNQISRFIVRFLERNNRRRRLFFFKTRPLANQLTEKTQQRRPPRVPETTGGEMLADTAGFSEEVNDQPGSI